MELVNNSRMWTVVVLVVVAVVIIASFYFYVGMHKDDGSLSATLYYRYIPGSTALTSVVHVWGDVYNWGNGATKGKLTIVITDDEGHRMKDTFGVGPVPPQDAISVDKTYQWTYLYDPVEHPVAPVDVACSI